MHYITRAEAIVIAKEAAEVANPSYYTDETFEPDEWVVQAILIASEAAWERGYERCLDKVHWGD